jgi:COG4 transport protein
MISTSTITHSIEQQQHDQQQYDIELARLDKEELDLLHARAVAKKNCLLEVEREIERSMEGVRRALPELDVVSKTAAELRVSIRKTMERADVVSVRVRQLDLGRSRAVEALEYSNRCVECQKCVIGAREALLKGDVEKAAGFSKKFDLLANQIQVPSMDDMIKIRTELERLILQDVQSHTGYEHTSAIREIASKDNWLESDLLKENLKQASVMSKVSDIHAAETKYSQFLSLLLKERIQSRFTEIGLENQTFADDSKMYCEALKYLLNSSAMLIEANSRIPEPVLNRNSLLVVLRAIHVECDRSTSLFFDIFMTNRRLHERAAQQNLFMNPSLGMTDHQRNYELNKLNHLIIETCITMQHVETYDRFVRARHLNFVNDYNPEYRRIIQEIAGVYTLLEKQWITESLYSAIKIESTLELPIGNRILCVSSLVEGGFYIAKRAIKRGLGTGSGDASCGCINIVISCLEDILLNHLQNSSSKLSQQQQQQLSGGTRIANSNGIITSIQQDEDALIQFMNTIEIGMDYCNKLYQEISTNDAFERKEDFIKVKSCADGLFDLSCTFDSKRNESTQKSIYISCSHSIMYKSAIENIDSVSYNLDEVQYERDDPFAAKFVAAVGQILNRYQNIMSDVTFERSVEYLAFRVSEEIEKGIVVKQFSQLGGLRLEKDIRLICESLVAFVLNPLLIRSIFVRLLQISTLLSVSALEEAHDVWDSFNTLGLNNNTVIKPKDRLNAKEAKRILGRRLDFDQREVQKMKLL